MLIRQSKGETETLGRRDMQMSNRLRQIEANLESYSREEIREIYTSVRDSQMRLFLIRNQNEQLEHKRNTLERYIQQLQKMSGLLQSLEVAQNAPMASPPSTVPPTPQQTILRIIDAQEKERQLLARQMHDGPASSLSNLVLQAEVVERLFNLDPVQARTELSALKTAVNGTFQRTRDFIFNLRPMMLDDLGLFPTLRRYVQEYQSKTKINAQLTIMGKDRRLPAHTEVILFRVIQELLNNVQQHANASRVQITLDVSDTFVVATIEDDGSGFDVQQALNNAREQKTLGISNILERTEMLGGEIHFESNLGRGTRVSLKLPALE
jgi:two-component system sensor histidine kinase DegS